MTHTLRRASLLALSTLSLVTFACGADDSAAVAGVGSVDAFAAGELSQAARPVRMTGIVVRPADVTLPVGATQQLDVVARFSDDSEAPLDVAVAWTSNKPERASVSATGLVTALVEGNKRVRIRASATVGGRTFSDVARVLVTAPLPPPPPPPPPPPAPVPVALDIVAATEPLTVVAGVAESVQLIATFSDGSSREVTSDDGLQATITPFGAVTILEDEDGSHALVGHAPAGNASISIECFNLHASLDVVVLPPAPVSLAIIASAAEPLELTAGIAQPVHVIATFSDGSSRLVTAADARSSSSSPAGALSLTDDNNGNQLLVGHAPGDATLTVECFGLQASLAVVVLPPIPVALHIVSGAGNGGILEVVAGVAASVQFIATFSDGSSREVTSDADGLTATIAPFGALTILEDADGRHSIVGHFAGDASVVIECFNLQASLDVVIAPPAPVSIDVVAASAPLTLPLGIEAPVQLLVTFTDGSARALTNADGLSSQSVPNGLVTLGDDNEGNFFIVGHAQGNATFTVSAFDLQASLEVIVAPPVPQYLDIVAASEPLSIAAGVEENVQFVATFSDGSAREVTSADGLAASVDPAGALSVREDASTGRHSVVGLAADSAAVLIIDCFGMEASLAVIVTAPVPVSLEIVAAAEPLVIARGDEEPVLFVASFSDGSSREVTSDDGLAASVVPFGALTIHEDAAGGHSVVANAAGNASLAIQCFGLSASLAVVVVPPRGELVVSVDVTPSSLSLATATSGAFRAHATFGDGAVRDVTNEASWTSSNDAAVFIGNGDVTGGRAFAMSSGSATIHATLGGVSGAASVSSAGLAVIRITGAPATQPPIAQGFTATFVANAIMADNSPRNLTAQAVWTSSEPDVAPVRNGTAAGVAAAVDAGDTVISATFGPLTTAPLALTVATRPFIFGSRPSNPVVSVGGTQQMRAVTFWSDGVIEDVTADTTFSGVAGFMSISNDPATKGLATGLAAASIGIGALWRSPSDGVNRFASQTATVTLATLSSISVRAIHAPNVVPPGGTEEFEAIGRWSDGVTRQIDTQVVWSSPTLPMPMAPTNERAAVATPGVHVVSATLQGVTGSTTFSVRPTTLTSITIASGLPPAPFTVGQQRNLFATGHYDDGSTFPLPAAQWSSSDPLVLDVSNRHFDRGRITGVRAGSAQVRVELDGIVGALDVPVAVR